MVCQGDGAGFAGLTRYKRFLAAVLIFGCFHGQVKFSRPETIERLFGAEPATKHNSRLQSDKRRLVEKEARIYTGDDFPVT